MNRWHAPGVGLAILAFCVTGLAQTSNLPSLTEVEADFNGQRYGDVVRKSAGLLQVRAGVAGPERVAVLELKAEAHIRLKQYPAASDAFTAASKEHPADSKEAAVAVATARLLKSVNAIGQYVPRAAPRGARPTPISILEPADRERAFLALFEDEQKAVEAQIARLDRQRTLPLLQDSIQKVTDLRTLEMAALGTDASSKLMFEPLKAHAVALFDAPLQALIDKVDHLSRLASRDRTMAQTVNSSGVRQEVAQKVGLTAAERNELVGIEKDLATIVSITEEIGKKMGVDLADFTGARRGGSGSPRIKTLAVIYCDAHDELDHARELLNTKFVSTPVNATRGRSTRTTTGE